MVITPQAFTESRNGRQQTTDGLWVHRGQLIVRAGPVDLPDGSIGTAELADGAVTGAKIADGTVGTVDLAANAATKVTPIQSAPSGSTTSVSAVAAPSPFNNIVVSGHTGGLTVVHGTLHLYHSVANGFAYIQIGVNGGGGVLCFYGALPVAGTTQGIPIHMYSAAGTTITSVQVYWYTNTGTLSWSTGVYSFLFITEYKR